MAHSAPGTWTEDRIELFNSMREQMPQAIWEALNALPGLPISKGAVIGRRDRLRGAPRKPKRTQEEIIATLLARRDRDNAYRRAKRAAEPKKVPAVRAKSVESPPPFMCDAADVVSLRKSLLDLEPNDCRWPYDATAEEKAIDSVSFRFCGHIVLDGSYCFGHTKLSMRSHANAEQRKEAA